MKDHCHYCNKSLYRMYMKQGLYSVVPDKEDYRNTAGNRICETCNARLLRPGHKIGCPVCETDVYELRYDMFKERKITIPDLKGIAPQPDPYEGAFLRCRHCDNEIHLFE